MLLVSEMSTREIVEERGRVRAKIKYLESLSSRTTGEDAELREKRAWLRSLMKEAGKRFIQLRLC